MQLGPRVADEVDLHRIADPDHRAADVDLHGPRLVELGQDRHPFTALSTVGGP
jgi:hypothetical protein